MTKIPPPPPRPKPATRVEIFKMVHSVNNRNHRRSLSGLSDQEFAAFMRTEEHKIAQATRDERDRNRARKQRARAQAQYRKAS